MSRIKVSRRSGMLGNEKKRRLSDCAHNLGGEFGEAAIFLFFSAVTH